MIHWIKVVAIIIAFFTIWTLLSLTYQWAFYGFSEPFWSTNSTTPLSFIVMLLLPAAIAGMAFGISHALKGDL